MTSHELAKKLLECEDLPVIISFKGGCNASLDENDEALELNIWTYEDCIEINSPKEME
jgi:hypothetical protein